MEKSLQVFSDDIYLSFGLSIEFLFQIVNLLVLQQIVNNLVYLKFENSIL